jgi:hypothetical protein
MAAISKRLDGEEPVMEMISAAVWVENRFERWAMPMSGPPDRGLLLGVTANGICGTVLHLIEQGPATPLILWRPTGFVDSSIMPL